MEKKSNLWITDNQVWTSNAQYFLFDPFQYGMRYRIVIPAQTPVFVPREPLSEQFEVSHSLQTLGTAQDIVLPQGFVYRDDGIEQTFSSSSSKDLRKLCLIILNTLTPATLKEGARPLTMDEYVNENGIKNFFDFKLRDFSSHWKEDTHKTLERRSNESTECVWDAAGGATGLRMLSDNICRVDFELFRKLECKRLQVVGHISAPFNEAFREMF